MDLADHPVNRSGATERTLAVEAGSANLARTIREIQPERVSVLLRRIAPVVRRAAHTAEFDDRDIEVLPFPTRQWRPVYVNQLAGIISDVFRGEAAPATLEPHATESRRPQASAETSTDYGSNVLHGAIAEVLRSHGNAWMRASAIASEIAVKDLSRRPTSARHARASQVSARALKVYRALFQTSDLGIRLRIS